MSQSTVGPLSRRRARTFAALKQRNFRIFFAGQAVSAIGMWMEALGESLLVLHLTDGDGRAVGLIAALHFLPMLVLGPWAGAVVDRTDTFRLLQKTQVGLATTSGVLAVLVFTGAVNVWLVAVIAAATGLVSAFENPTRRSFIKELVPPSELPNAVGLNSSLIAAGRVIGPAIAGLTVGTLGYGMPFLLNAVSFGCVIVALARIDRTRLRRSTSVARDRGQVREGIRYAMGDPGVRLLLTSVAIVSTCAYNFPTLLPLLATETFRSSEFVAGLLFAVCGTGALIGSLYTAGRAELTEAYHLRASVGFGLAMLAVGATPTVTWSVLPLVLLGLAAGAFIGSGNALIQVRVAPAMTGRVLALYSVVFLGSTAVGAPVVGFISELASPRVAFAYGGVMALVAAAWGGRHVRRNREYLHASGDAGRSVV